MKFQVKQTALTIGVGLKDLIFSIEGKSIPFIDVMALCKRVSSFCIDNVAGTSVDVFTDIDIPVIVQGVSTTGGFVTTMTMIDASGEAWFKNFTPSATARFIGGKSYLVTYVTATPILPMTRPSMSVEMQNYATPDANGVDITPAVTGAKFYQFDAPVDTDTLGGVVATIYAFDVNFGAMNKAQEVSKAKKVNEVQQIAIAQDIKQINR